LIALALAVLRAARGRRLPSGVLPGLSGSRLVVAVRALDRPVKLPQRRRQMRASELLQCFRGMVSV